MDAYGRGITQADLEALPEVQEMLCVGKHSERTCARRAWASGWPPAGRSRALSSKMPDDALLLATILAVLLLVIVEAMG